MTDDRPYLLEVTDVLWPGRPATLLRGSRASGGGGSFVAVPSGKAPRLLLPDDRAAAAGAVQAFISHSSRGARLRTRIVGGLFSAGLGGAVFRDRVRPDRTADGDGIVDELEEIVGEPVRVAVRTGPPRANRKPVLAVLDRRGRLLAFAKVGLSPLTRELLATEASALATFAAVPADVVRVPRLLHHGEWRDMTLLVQEALPTTRARRVDPALLVRAIESVARSSGTTTAPWGRSTHAALVRGRLPRIASTPAAELLAESVDTLAADPEVLLLGSWHGDWTPWNSASLDDAVLLWDWERFGVGVPIGFDLLHHDLQTGLDVDCTPERAAALLSRAPDRLAALGLTRAQAVRTALAYLIELASRYLVDDQVGAGAHVGDVGRWLIPVLTPAVRQLIPRGEMST
jgi:hypothetical protein